MGLSPLSREQAGKLLGEWLSDKYLLNHCLATEAIMRALSQRFDEDLELWGITGLLHDLDLEKIDQQMSQHALVTAAKLTELHFPEAAIYAIKAHNGDLLGIECQSRLDLCLTSAESVTGLIVATALIMPDKKLASVKASSVQKRMKEKRFAANVNRDRILKCEQIPIPLPEFIELALGAMVQISDQIGL